MNMLKRWRKNKVIGKGVRVGVMREGVRVWVMTEGVRVGMISRGDERGC